MSFGNSLRRILPSRRALFRIYFGVGTIIIILVFTVYVYLFQREASKEARVVPDLVNQFMFYSSHENHESIMTQYILTEIIANVEYPIIITDERQIPIFWKNINVPENVKWSLLTPEVRTRVRERIFRMNEKGHVMTLTQSGEENSPILGYTFYEDSKVVKRLKILPYVEVVLILFFLSFGTYALTQIRNTEKRMIWVGLAKETAHQFGTPISSLLAWLDLIKLKIDNIPNNQEYLEIHENMSIDVMILGKIASRFGKVGSDIALKATNVDDIIIRCIEYFRKRLPHIDNEIHIFYHPRNMGTTLMLDDELFSWALENLIRNSIDAMKFKKGDITIESYVHDEDFRILVCDQGIGMSKSIFNKIFDPGYTTKSRGWGLGLSLTKRIIEEYHHGKIMVLEISADGGTTIGVFLPFKRNDG